MDKTEAAQKRIRVARVITSPEVVEYHLRNMLNHLDKYADFSLEIIGTGVSRYEKLWPGVQFTDLKIERKIHPLNDFVALLKLTSHFLKTKPDIVHSIMPKAGLLSAIAGLLARVPVRMHTFTGQIWANKSGLKKRFFISLDKLVINLNKICLTDSVSQSEFLLKNGVGYLQQPIPVLGKGSLSGVDLKRFDPDRFKEEAAKMRQSYGIAEDDVVFAFIARKFRDKGVFELVEAFNQLCKKRKNCYLLFVGPDESLEFTEYFKTVPREHIISEGHTSSPELYLACSDVLCLPSYREGFGSIVIDAAAMKIPTIATKIPGLIDAVEENVTGLFVEMKDAKALEETMDKLLGDHELRRQLGQAAQQRVKDHFSSEKLSKDLFNFYREQLGNQQNSPRN